MLEIVIATESHNKKPDQDMDINQSKKTRKTFDSRFLAAFLAFVCVNILIAIYMPKEEKLLDLATVTQSPNESRQEGSWIWWITRGYLQNAEKCDIALLGSSQMGAALYSAEALHKNLAVDTVIERRCSAISSSLERKTGLSPETFNFSFGGAMISDQYMIAKALFNDAHKPKLVVLGVNPRDFMDNSLPSASATEPFRYLSPYVKLGGLNSCAYADPFEWLDWCVSKQIPTRVAAEKYAKLIPNVVLNSISAFTTSLSGVSLHELQSSLETASREGKLQTESECEVVNALDAVYQKAGEVSPGKWKVAAFGWGVFEDNTKEYKVRYKNARPPLYESEKKFFNRLLDYLSEQKIETVVIGMPSLWPNRALLPEDFWAEFRADVESACLAHGAQWIDLSSDKRFAAADYLDTVHLNSSGGTKLVEAITDIASPAVAQLFTRDDDDKRTVAETQRNHGL